MKLQISVLRTIDHITKGPVTGFSPVLRLEPNLRSIPPLYLGHAEPFIFRRDRAADALATMGITGILKELPGGDMKTSAYVGFDTLDLLRGVPVDIDTGTLLYACALRHKDAFNAGD